MKPTRNAHTKSVRDPLPWLKAAQTAPAPARRCPVWRRDVGWCRTSWPGNLRFLGGRHRVGVTTQEETDASSGGLILVTVFTRGSCDFPNFYDVWMVVGSIAYHPAGDTHGPLKCWVATLRWRTLMYRCLCVSGILPLYSFVSLSFEINGELHPK